MTHDIRPATLKVPGATLYYEAQGAGPVLLIIPGGPQDAGVFGDLIGRLADRYTVVAYDPRGNSRSTFDGAPVEQDLDVHGDDAAAIIEALCVGAAYVFGTSGGAQIGFNLAARHPELVRALVAHEPPAMLLLDDPSEALAADEALHDTYLREGVDAAMGQFFAANGFDEGDGPPPEFDMPPAAAETFARVSANFEYWLAHGILPLSRYRPDIDVLRAGAPRVMVALGEQSAGQPIYDMGLAAAKRLGVAPLAFPGDHTGFETDPDGFAAAIDRAFAGR